MKRIIMIFVLVIFIASIASLQAAEEQIVTGKDIFTKVKGPYGSCNSCHPDGGTAGKWDSEYEEISDEGDKKIPSLKGIGEKKSKDQVEKAIKLVMKKYKVPVKEEQLAKLVEYVSGL